jgi:hypothetical protein
LAREASTVLDIASGEFVYDADGHSHAPIMTNGDAELWERLCTFENPLPILAVNVPYLSNSGPPDPAKIKTLLVQATSLYHRTKPGDTSMAPTYPPDAKFADRTQIVEGATADRQRPWCLVSGPTAADQDFAKRLAETVGKPLCRSELLATNASGTPVYRYTEDDLDLWVNRGAANAGLAVFLYLDGVARGEVSQLPYDRCDLLTESQKASH